MICDKLQQCFESEKGQRHIEFCTNGNRSVCIESADTRKLIKCEEKGKKYILDNHDGNFVVAYKVDGGIICQDESVEKGVNKCDYLLAMEMESPSAILVELKGKDIGKGMVQINETLTRFKQFFRSFSHVYGRIVVASSSPKLTATPEYVKLEKKLKRDFQGNIKVKERQLKEKVVDLSNTKI